MNKKDLVDLGVAEDVAEKIIVLHGKDIEAHKTKLTTSQTDAETIKAQLLEANTTIESFKAMKPEELKSAADDYKAKYEQAVKDGEAQVAAVKFDNALMGALKEYRVRDPLDVLPRLKKDTLKMDEDGKFIGLKEQIDPLIVSKGYLFEEATPSPTQKPGPQFVSGTQSQTIISDAVIAATRKGAGLP